MSIKTIQVTEHGTIVPEGKVYMTPNRAQGEDIGVNYYYLEGDSVGAGIYYVSDNDDFIVRYVGNEPIHVPTDGSYLVLQGGPWNNGYNSYGWYLDYAGNLYNLSTNGSPRGSQVQLIPPGSIIFGGGIGGVFAKIDSNEVEITRSGDLDVAISDMSVSFTIPYHLNQVSSRRDWASVVYWGDGSNTPVEDEGSGIVFNHTYSEPGEYRIVLVQAPGSYAPSDYNGPIRYKTITIE